MGIMLLYFSQTEIPPKKFLQKSKEIPIGMIGAIPVELKRSMLGTLEISTPYAAFDVLEETMAGIAREMEKVIEYFVGQHPKFLYSGFTR